MYFIQGYRKVTRYLRHVANTRTVKPLRFLANTQGRFARIANLLWQSAKSLNSNIMANFTQKELKQLVENGAAIDATNDSTLIKNDPYWWIIGFSKGIYGINGCLIYTSSGKLYAITKRSSSLFYFL